MERALDRTDTASGMLDALTVTAAALSRVGAARVEVVTISRRWVCLQPTHLAEGKDIARELSLDLPMDHRMTTPGYTVWSGDRDGLTLQVRAALRQPVGILR